MSVGTGIAGVRAAVRSLEIAAGKGWVCAPCRSEGRRKCLLPGESWQPPEDSVVKKCEFCGTEYVVSLAAVPRGLWDAHRLRHSFTLEDQFTNPKAHALELWFSWARAFERKIIIGQPSDKVMTRPSAAGRELSRLKAEASRLRLKRMSELAAKYGSAFPEHARLITSISKEQASRRKVPVGAREIPDLVKAETAHLVRAALEKIIWGETRPETAAAAGKLGGQINLRLRAWTRQHSGPMAWTEIVMERYKRRLFFNLRRRAGK